MRKPYKDSELSDVKCKDCSKKLKKNLLAKSPIAERCYDCHCKKKHKGKYAYTRVKETI